jgi:hypothetical protein
LTPGEAWQRVTAAFREAADLAARGRPEEARALLQEAKRPYVQQFQPKALFVALEEHQQVTALFQEAEKGLEAGGASSLGQVALKMDARLIAIAFKAVEDALARGDPSQVSLWYGVIVQKFDLVAKPFGLTVLVIEARRQPALQGLLRDRIRAGLLLLLLERVQERVDAALKDLAPPNPGTGEKALEGRLLYQVVQTRVREELGRQDEEAVATELEGLQRAIETGASSQARQAAEGVRARLAPLLERLRNRQQATSPLT